MSKRPFLILSLLISVLTLVYLIMERKGIIRDWYLHNSNTDTYLKKYNKLTKTDKDKVVVCFSSNPEKLHEIKPFLNSILDQSVKVDEIILNIPYKDMSKIPSSYKNILSVHGYSKDYEDAANLVCSVLTEPEANTKIVLVDPGTLYKQDFIELMLEKSKEFPDKIVYGDKNKNTHAGILLKPKFFDNKISDYKKGNKCSKWLEECSSVSSVNL